MTGVDPALLTALDWLVGAIKQDYADLGPRVAHDVEVIEANAKREKEARRKRVEADKAERAAQKAEEDRLRAAGEDVDAMKKAKAVEKAIKVVEDYAKKIPPKACEALAK